MAITAARGGVTSTPLPLLYLSTRAAGDVPYTRVLILALVLTSILYLPFYSCCRRFTLSYLRPYLHSYLHSHTHTYQSRIRVLVPVLIPILNHVCTLIPTPSAAVVYTYSWHTSYTTTHRHADLHILTLTAILMPISVPTLLLTATHFAAASARAYTHTDTY